MRTSLLNDDPVLCSDAVGGHDVLSKYFRCALGMKRVRAA
jgi:hypothetical protein